MSHPRPILECKREAAGEHLCGEDYNNLCGSYDRITIARLYRNQEYLIREVSIFRLSRKFPFYSFSRNRRCNVIQMYLVVEKIFAVVFFRVLAQRDILFSRL